jgi:hypothetical protein
MQNESCWTGSSALLRSIYAFTAPEKNLPNRSNRFLFLIRVDQFMQEAYDKAFEYDWTRAGIKLIEDQAGQFENISLPLSVVGKGGWALRNWVQVYEQFWKDKAAESKRAKDKKGAVSAIRHVANANRSLGNCPFSSPKSQLPRRAYLGCCELAPRSLGEITGELFLQSVRWNFHRRSGW